jgi:hypothetical protein
MMNQKTFGRVPTCGENDVDLRVATEPRRVTDAVLSQIIATKDGEIAALTAEVTHLAEKLAERDAKVAGVDGWTIGNAKNGQISVQKVGVGGYLAERESDSIASSILYELACSLRYTLPASAPSVDRNSADGLNGGMHDSIFVRVWGDAGGGDDGRRALAQYAYNIGFADHAKMRREIDDLVASIPDAASPQPVDAAPATGMDSCNLLDYSAHIAQRKAAGFQPMGLAEFASVVTENARAAAQAVPEHKLDEIQRNIARYGSLSHVHWPLAPMAVLEEIMRSIKNLTAPSPAAQPAAQAVPELQRQAVATVVSRSGDDLRVGWLRPERCTVGTLLFCAVEPTDTTKGA